MKENRLVLPEGVTQEEMNQRMVKGRAKLDQIKAFVTEHHSIYEQILDALNRKEITITVNTDSEKFNRVMSHDDMITDFINQGLRAAVGHALDNIIQNEEEQGENL